MSKGAAMTAESWVFGAAASRTKRLNPCGCWSSGERPCWVDEWAAERAGPAASDEVYGVEMGNERYEMAGNWTLGGEIDIEDCDLLRLDLATADMPEVEIKQYLGDQPGHRSWCGTFETANLSAAIRSLFETYKDFDKVITPAGRVFEQTTATVRTARYGAGAGSTPAPGA